ncbi:NAD(P)-dependent oxidoreductase [Microbacterium sp. J1-1]|uniref:NAD(P)-dependent oxidoreductase n=1 Tax=Microbacterium sp. J1-1 TaxID=2992441 RepID=UPI00211512EC|nr:NAD(P)-dependent oxidoreductase [Microbacterium sp. J1-1]UUE19379.1 NAD(P)-dependent oxidoreductase [Microbacterium sp. J1-1]
MNHPPETRIEPVGFIGLGLMGSAMAQNLHKQVPLVVWNRTPSASEPLHAAGATVAPSAQAIFENTRIIFVMLSDETAIDTVLSSMSHDVLRGRIIVLMSTVSPHFSTELARRVTDAAGMYVEAPVSGSRQPAVDGTLISMLAGDDDVLDRIEPLVHAMCATAFRCGAVPSALTMKLAVNTFLITLVTGLAEAFHFAEANGVDPALLSKVLDTGPMASAVSRAKGAKFTAEDWTPHAAIPDVLKNSRLVQEHARHTGSASPLIDVCTALYAETASLGHSADDMAAVIAAFRERTRTAAETTTRTNA